MRDPNRKKLKDMTLEERRAYNRTFHAKTKAVDVRKRALQAARSKRWRDKNPGYYKIYPRKPLTPEQYARKLEMNKQWRRRSVVYLAEYNLENASRHNATRRRRFGADPAYKAKEQARTRLWKIVNAEKVKAYEKANLHKHRAGGRYDPAKYKLNKQWRNFARTLAENRRSMA